MTQGLKCPRCKATEHIWRKGYHPTNQGYRPRYVCYDCGKTFYNPDEPPITLEEYEKRTSHMSSHFEYGVGLCPSVE